MIECSASQRVGEWAVSFLAGRKYSATLEEKLDRMSIPEPMSGCILWLGCTITDGYGMLNVGKGKGNKLAHRVAWELVNGAIPADCEIDHICRVRSCINPAHMRAVSHKVNVLAGESFSAHHARKGTCVHGHQFDGIRKGNGQRTCSTCRKMWQAAARDRRR